MIALGIVAICVLIGLFILLSYGLAHKLYFTPSSETQPLGVSDGVSDLTENE